MISRRYRSRPFIQFFSFLFLLTYGILKAHAQTGNEPWSPYWQIQPDMLEVDSMMSKLAVKTCYAAKPGDSNSTVFSEYSRWGVLTFRKETALWNSIRCLKTTRVSRTCCTFDKTVTYRRLSDTTAAPLAQFDYTFNKQGRMLSARHTFQTDDGNSKTCKGLSTFSYNENPFPNKVSLYGHAPVQPEENAVCRLNLAEIQYFWSADSLLKGIVTYDEVSNKKTSEKFYYTHSRLDSVITRDTNQARILRIQYDSKGRRISAREEKLFTPGEAMTPEIYATYRYIYDKQGRLTKEVRELKSRPSTPSRQWALAQMGDAGYVEIYYRYNRKGSLTASGLKRTHLTKGTHHKISYLKNGLRKKQDGKQYSYTYFAPDEY